MKNSRPLTRIALAAVAVAIVALPHDSSSQVCDDGTARNLLLGARIDQAINPPDKEDVEFFSSRGGAPNVLIVLDTSGSMERLPPDGPHSLGYGGGAYTGANPVIGTDVPQSFQMNGGRSNTTTQNNALAATVATRPTGCGLDPVSAAAPNLMTFPQISSVDARRFNPPCPVEFTDTTLKGQPYATDAIDYADKMKVCPYFLNAANPQATGAPGFDPDYYTATAGALTGGGGVAGRVNYFPKDLVFHDNEAVGSYAYSSTLPFGHNFGDGWADGALYPARVPPSPPAPYVANTIATVDGFCDTFKGNTVLQGTRTRADICKECLHKKGWWYDGITLTTTDNGTNYGYPSFWYTGNYLNFFPPKFLVAKKVLKDLVATQTSIRLAINKFDSVGSAPYVAFAPTCTADAAGTDFTPSRQSFVTSINNISFGGGTPLSRALFDGGRYFHTPTLPWFGATWENSAKESSGTAGSAAVCYACQTSSIVLMTDGAPNPPDGDGTDLPPGGLTTAQLTGAVYAGDPATGIQGITSAVCPSCATFTGANSYMNNTSKVAFYLHNMDLRQNTDTTLDCKGNGGKQTVDVYTVGFGTSALPSANQILQNTATAGGGVFVPAEDTSTLKTAFQNIFNQINTRSTSFSTATVSTLQTTAGRSVIVPRFEPARTNLWQGHLSRFDLYSEFVSACTETAAGNGPGDLDCDGRCTSVFLQDKDGDFISPDSNGVFRKNDPPNLPTCDVAPLCPTKGKPCASVGTAIAKEWWEAGSQLQTRTWQSRKIYSVVDSNGDGKLDSADPVFELDTSNDTAATKLVPYLGLGGPTSGPNIGSPICNAIATRLNANGKLAWGTAISTSNVECVKTIVRYLKGADLFNETGGAGYLALASQETLWDRKFKLGDIFHSSPVVVEPPFPPSGIMCAYGLTNQCLPALWKTPTKHSGASGNAYADFVASPAYQNRRKVVLVGANDGLLHAFNGGTWLAGADDPTTTGLDESKPPFNGYYERGDLSGGATELWAFLPPGMLGRIPLLVGSSHQIFVDGSPMVREVWVDGTSNGLTAASSADDVKDKQEFHTVAVIPLRRGGTHFFALDVTNATEAGQPPAFLWMFPQPNDKRVLTMGETYDSFLPRPPPIGPVRVRADANSGVSNANTPVWSQALGGATAYHERWVAFLNGGFDPAFLRGRGAYMVDVWTGKPMWDFAYPANPGAADPADPRLQLRYPVPASVGMFPWGQNAVRKEQEVNDYFFDTASFGDAGGQIWTLRFSEPGQLDGTGMATNWFGGRTFQMGGVGSCKLCGGQPFFYMTANIQLPETAYLRIFAGTGDRFNMLDPQPGGQCGPDNLRACALRGCTVDMQSADNSWGSTDLTMRSFTQNASACAALTQNQSDAAWATCSAKGSVKMTITCPSPASSTVKNVAMECFNDQNGEYNCQTTVQQSGTDLTLSDTTNAPNVGNWYFSLLGFEESGSRKIFSDYAGAKAYDAARLQVSQAGGVRSATAGIVMMAASTNNPSPLADGYSKGWAIYYDHDGTTAVSGTTFAISWMDERTVTTSAVLGRVVTWNSVQTAKSTGSAGACAVSKCAFDNQRVSYHYNADVVTGAPILTDPTSGILARAYIGVGLVPPQGDQATSFVNQKGQVARGLTTVNVDTGARNVAMTAAQEPTYGVGVVEVSQKAHACRHAWPGSSANPVAQPPTEEACR